MNKQQRQNSKWLTFILNLCSNKGNTNKHNDIFHTSSDLQILEKYNQSKHWQQCRGNDFHLERYSAISSRVKSGVSHGPLILLLRRYIQVYRPEKQTLLHNPTYIQGASRRTVYDGSFQKLPKCSSIYRQMDK